MKTTVFAACIAMLFAQSFGARAADEAADYPNKPIRVVIGF